ncbi:MAG: hypothetical protein P1U65_05075 [Minwuia sp.]|nr:hypothetical protein [Minwuia sp.]
MLLKWPKSAPESDAAPDSNRSALTVQSLDRLRRGTATVLVALTLGWLAIVLIWFAQSVGLAAAGLMLPHELATVVLAAFVPPAFIWLAGFWYWRSVDSGHSRSALQEILKDMSFPDPEAEARLNAMALSLRRLSQALESETTNALARVDRLDERIGKGTEALSAAAQRSAEQSDELGQTITTRAEDQRRLLAEVRALDAEVRDLGDRQGTALGQAVADAGRRTAEIEASLRTQLVAADDMVEQVAKRAGQINTMLEQPMARLREEADSTVRRVSGVSQDLRNRMESLSQVIARTMDQSEGLREGMDGQIARLNDSLGSVQATMASVIADSRSELALLDEGTAKSADRAAASVAAVTARNAALAKLLDDIGIATAEAEQALQATADNTWLATQRFAAEVEVLDEKGRDASSRTDDLAQRMETLTGSLVRIDERLAATSSRLTTSRDELEASVSEMQGTTVQLIDSVEERLKAAASMAVASSERSEERVLAVADRLKTSIGELSDYIGKVETRAFAAAGRGDAQVEALGARAVELSEIVASIDSAVAQGGISLGAVVGRTETALQSVRSGLEDVGSALEDMDLRAGRSVTLLQEREEAISVAGAHVLDGMERMDRAFALRSDALERLGLRVSSVVERAETDVTARVEGAATLLEKMAADSSLVVGRTAEAVRDLLADMEGRTERIGARVGSVNEATAETTAQVDERVAELSLLLKDIERAVADTGTQITDVDAQARGVVAGLTEGVGSLSDAAQRMDEHALGAEQRLLGLSSVMEARTETLSDLVDRLAQAASSADGDVRARLEGLAGDLEQAMAQTRQVTLSLGNEVTRLDTAGAEVAGRIDVSIANVDERLAEAAQAADAAAGRMSEKTAEIALMVGDLGAAAQQADTGMTDMRNGLANVVAEANEATGSLIGELRALGEATLRSTDGLHRSATAVSARNAALVESFSAATEALGKDGGRIGDLIDALRDAVGGAEAEIAPGLERMAGRVRDSSELARMMVEALEAGSGAMTAEAEGIRARLVALTEDLDTRVRGLDTAADAVTTRIIGAAGEIELRAESLGAVGKRIGDETLGQAEALADRIGALASRVDESEGRMSTSGQRIEEASNRSTAAARSATTAIAEAVSAIDAGLERTGDMELAAGRLAGAAEDAQSRMGTAAEESMQLARDLTEASTALTDQTRSLVEAAAGGASRLATALANARQETARFTESETRARAEVEEVVDALNARMTLVQSMATTLSATGQEIDSMLAVRIDALAKASDASRTASDAMTRSVSDQQQRLDDVAASARQHAEAMAENVGATITRLQTEAQALDELLDTAGLTGKGAVDAVAGSVTRLQEMLDATRATVARSGEQAETSTDALARQRAAFAETVAEARTALTAVERDLGTQASALASASKAATMQSGLAARAFEVQVGQLQKASKGAAQAAVELRDRTTENRDKRFLQSAAFVAEGLNSLSLDLHRLLDRDATEAEWRKFYRGDRGFFARRLVARSEAKRIAALYRDGDDFRRFVDLYLNEFDSLMLNVERADQEGMLSAVFLSADVGKLYLLLCEALDRDPGGKRLFGKAS